MRPNALRTLASLAALAVLSFPHDSVPQTPPCNDPAARNLLAGAYADAILNPPNQEDNQFFTSQGGFPNIFFLIDTSGSMLRLPPNGPPNDTSAAMPPAGQVGCGGTVARGGLPIIGTVLDTIRTRVYHSPCGTTGAAYENQRYLGHPVAFGTGVDYGQLASACPYYSQSDTYVSGAPGYDPDFYDASNKLTSQGTAPNLFPRDLVFHDSLYSSPPAGWPADGWTFTSVNPWLKGGTPGAIADFCAAQGTTTQNGVTLESICNACLTQRGWYYDGKVSQWDAEFGSVHIPSIWYTGNYLSFFPPKFQIARRVVKDVIGTQSRIRMAVAQFGNNDYKFVKDFNPSCQSIFSNGSWENNRISYVNAVNSSLVWGGSTPLAKSLFDVGRYYHSPDLTWFGTTPPKTGTWLSADTANQSAVCWSCQVSSVIILTDGAPSAGATPPSSADGNDLPAGRASIADSNSGMYAGDTNSGILDPRYVSNPDSTDCPQCGEFKGNDDFLNNLARVSFYLHNYDLRSEPGGTAACGTGGKGGTLDGKGMPGKQTLDIYTVGFGTSAIGNANRLLANAAKVGGGLFYGAESADELKAGVFKVFTAINERATSFSVATVSTLQTTTGHSVIVPRFDPSREAHWAGHLFRYELYSEFVNPCTPNGPGDLDCDGLCASVFLADKNGNFIGEDGNGSFMRTDNNLPPCSQTPACVAAGKSCGTVGNTAATPWWDAYQALKSQSWTSRYVWTVTDSTGDGKLTSADKKLQLDTSDPTADALVPYLGLGTNGAVCGGIATKIQTAGDPITAEIVRTSKRDCAKTIIRWLLGADVLNEVGRTPAQGWPPPLKDPSLPATAGDPTATPPVPPNGPDQDQLLDRPFKLGDIYHSSPVVVDAPLPSDGILCPNGLHNQCMESLWRTPVKHVSNVNQYDLYAKSDAYRNRRKIILVGANDGLLHAFNGGAWHPGKDDPSTAIDESLPPFNGYYDRGEEDGPKELWAFLPPDLISKVPNLLGTDHHLFVDGTAMVRDVWVDGTSNDGVTPAGDKEGMKSAAEFHTVAIVGERRGGTHYFALDVTNATKLDGAKIPDAANATHEPQFLWIYPQPNDVESLRFGETYTDFLPVPPPVGPVRIAADTNAQTYGLADDSNAPQMFVPDDPTRPVRYHELWVTLLPGGFDPSYLRGRGVHMVDVWRGTEVFDFSYTASSGDPRQYLQYPVAATPAMVMWGKSARRPSLGFENDGYFDTATFGDTGGQLWVLRFNRPATLSASLKATNWSGGRILVSGRSPSPAGSFCAADGGLPFFYITANTALPSSHVFRVYAGTGDRFNLLDTNGGLCGPDNVRACAQRGCSVSMPLPDNDLTATALGFDGQGLSEPACPTGTSGAACLFTRSLDVSSSPPACGITSATRMEVSSCPDTPSGGATSFSKDVGVRCAPDADGSYGCSTTKASTTASPATLGATIDQTPNLSTRPMQVGMYVSMKVFEDSGTRTIFDDGGGAQDYDSDVTQLRPLVSSFGPVSPAPSSWHQVPSTGIAIIDGSDDNPPLAGLADATSPGWVIFYNHGPQITTDEHTYNVSQLDERTSSVSGLYGKVLWNSIQPALSEATASAGNKCTASKCQGAFRRLSYHYGADAVTGGPVFQDSSGNPLRAIVQNTLVPPQGDQPTVFVNQKGQIAVGLTAVNPEKGASNLGMGAAMDPVTGLGVVEVSRDLHNCRHASSAVGATGPAASACQ